MSNTPDPANPAALADDVVLSVQNVSKKFCRNLKRSMAYGMQDLALNLAGIRRDLSRIRKSEFWAVRNVSLTVKRGEALGIIGDNGSGKSTLLRLLAGIFPPDLGSVSVRGRVGPLIALGAGFHPHMTGRENIYLNASILGMTREQVDEHYEAIVEFSELKPFMEAPVSTYSSGMYARLGFSIIANIQPDIMLVDEVLSVGDMAFQLKCRRLMTDFIDAGGAVVFVSHSLNMVQSLCPTIKWMERGESAMEGPAAEVLVAYQDRLDQTLLTRALEGTAKEAADTGDIVINKTVLRNGAGEETHEFRKGDTLRVELHYETTKPVPAPYLWLAVASQRATLFGASMIFDGFRPECLSGKGVIACVFHDLPLLPSTYNVVGGMRAEDGAHFLIESRTFSSFRITGKGSELGLASPVAESMTRDFAPVLLPYEWHLPDGSRHCQEFVPRQDELAPEFGSPGCKPSRR